MALKTPEQYEESMRKMNFKIYLMGELVNNVTVLPTHLSIFHQPGYEFRQQ